MKSWVFTRSALNDLDGIWDYTAARWTRTQADDYIRAIFAACDAIGSGSVAGRSAQEIRPSYRKLAVGAHFVFYRIAEDDVAEIVRILHQRMDIAAQFKLDVF